MSVESLAEGIWQRQCDPSAFSTMAPGGFLRGAYGGRDWPSMTRWRALPGTGKAWTGPWPKLRWRWSAWGPTPRIGEKNGRKRSLLVDGRGVPLSLVASGANVHDVKLLAATLDQVVRARPAPRAKAPQHLCADAGYKGAPARQAVEKRHYRSLALHTGFAKLTAAPSGFPAQSSLTFEGETDFQRSNRDHTGRRGASSQGKISAT